ncbi:MAG: glycoside hydrolase family 19 protein [Rhodobacteraceae bacterium]|nr:MAG: glycoside hydrolase family 19 protein [Paracoccaceae bacterium]
MKITAELLAEIVGARFATDNMRSIVDGLEAYGYELGLDQPHRLAPYIAQTAHESGRYRYDREIWGPTRAQARYDTRTDLGNTPDRDGDGFKYRGRTGIQITGLRNTTRFYHWCKQRFPNRIVPNFVENPDAMNTDPWEGLGPLWYWEENDLNKWSDRGDMETLTKRINGGLNGYADRLGLYTRAALVLLGYGPKDVRLFQQHSGLVVDGDAGPLTRAALHEWLSDGEAMAA